MRYTFSTGSTNTFPSPTVPVRPPQNGAHRRLDEVVRHADIEAHLLGQLHLHRRAAIGLDVLAFAAVSLHARDGQALHLGLEELLQD
jgi:hypothetical protein